MMEHKTVKEYEFPGDVKIRVEDGLFTIVGSKGELKKTLTYPTVKSLVEDNKVKFMVTKKFTKREKMLVHTFVSRLKNYVKGVQEGHTYKLKICSGHFPMTVSVKDGRLEVKNFIGENTPRVLKLKQGAEVKVNGDEILVEGIDKELVSQVAADIERLTRRPGFDKRVFMDGIWITVKDGIALA